MERDNWIELEWALQDAGYKASRSHISKVGTFIVIKNANKLSLYQQDIDRINRLLDFYLGSDWSPKAYEHSTYSVFLPSYESDFESELV